MNKRLGSHGGIWPAMILVCLVFAGCRPDRAQPSAPRSGAAADAHAISRPYLDDPQVDVKDAAASQTEESWWRDETGNSGIDFVYRNGREGEQYTILETVGGGVALLDFDQDGDQDVFLPGGGTISSTAPIEAAGLPCGLFRNDGKGRFSNVSQLVRTSDPPLYSHGAFAADFDRDGFPDLLVTGFGGCLLLHNDRGQALIDVTATAGLKIPDWTTAAAWGDVNRDGWPDLMLVSYLAWTPHSDSSCGDAKQRIRDVCPPQKYPAARQLLFLNNGGQSFSQVETAFEGSGRGKGLGCVALDLNGDGWIDFYVANDQVANQLYLGGPAFPLAEVGVISATAGSEIGVPEGSMGADAGDYDGDGRPDLWVTNFELEDNSLYHNDGGGMFRHATVATGLGGIGRPRVGFGTGFVDFDLDGWLDLFVINGHVLYETGRSAYRQSPFLLRNESSGNGRRFRDVSREFGGTWFQGRYPGRGAAVGDLDNDGDPDMVVVLQNEPVSVLMNQNRPRNWLRLELRGVTSEPGAVGAVVRYRFEGRDLVRHVRSGAGYLSQFDQRILLPANDSTVPEVVVQWPTGKSERFRNLQFRSTNLIREGDGEPL